MDTIERGESFQPGKTFLKFHQWFLKKTAAPVVGAAVRDGCFT